MASGETPATTGIVSIEPGDGGRTLVRLRVKHLAPPSRFAPAAAVYVVWVHAQGAGIENAGTLKVDDHREGTLDFVTAHRVFRVVVTPETQGTVPVPSQSAVFSADVVAR
jgi:hypothetical protein